MNKKNIGYYIKMINILIMKNSNNYLKHSGLTHQQVNILLYIMFKKEVTGREIEKKFNISNPAVAGILNRLENNEYIERNQSKKDSRYKIINVTNKFLEIHKNAEKEINRYINLMEKNITEEEKSITLQTLKKIFNNLKGRDD